MCLLKNKHWNTLTSPVYNNILLYGLTYNSYDENFERKQYNFM